ncbi:MAG: DNA polymerase III subunit gamma/tau [Luteimonas sp.]
MSYLVLARKWRPKRFAELVGQEHVVRALTNALDSGRVHHAFLFSGTRGVGKTTIARIFAKSLNCERGTSAEPCGECNSCRDIDAGRFMDLLEIDAASNTGVDDVREVIENAQYMPSRGRVKVYLIDEVHMLSKPAFNALLKTLEEPPGHVKFLLATTDPQKLPVTVLSRCLQFNLKRLDEQQIGGQIDMILRAEGIAVEPGAIRQLAKAADGSLRDGLSLLDQAIAYAGAGATLTDTAVGEMLGTVDRSRVAALLTALGGGDGEMLLSEIAALAELSPDWNGVLDAFADALHRVQVRQLVPTVQIDADGIDVDALAGQLRPELVQLWYQMALNGRRDLPLAPSARAGFEMAMLRMLAFRPTGENAPAGRANSTPRVSNASSAKAALAEGQGSRNERSAVPAKPARSDLSTAPLPVAQVAVDASRIVAHVDKDISPIAIDAAIDAEKWLALVSTLRGPVRELAAHAGFIACDAGILRLSLSKTDDHLNVPSLVKTLADTLETTLGGPLKIRFESAPSSSETLHQRSSRERDARQVAAESAFLADAGVQQLIHQHGATVVPDSIRPFEE